jgi:hypothetical protein
LICPMHNDANVGPALNNTSIGCDWWNSGSTNHKFLGSLISDRSMGWSGTAGDIVGIIKKVTVRVYLPSIEVRGFFFDYLFKFLQFVQKDIW